MRIVFLLRTKNKELKMNHTILIEQILPAQQGKGVEEFVDFVLSPETR